MLLLIDSADLNEIAKMLEYFPCDGVTTNPSILNKTNTNPMPLLKKIRAMLPESSSLHVQVVSNTAHEMLKEADYILDELGEHTYIKVPAFDEGIKAIKLMRSENINVTATAIYTPMQAFIAAKAGANFVAPYVNRLDNMGVDGVLVAKDIHDMLTVHDLSCKVLAASFKNTRQVLELCEYGIGSVTAAPDIIAQFVKHSAVDAAIADFKNDFEKLCGKGKTMLP